MSYLHHTGQCVVFEEPAEWQRGGLSLLIHSCSPEEMCPVPETAQSHCSASMICNTVCARFLGIELVQWHLS